MNLHQIGARAVLASSVIVSGCAFEVDSESVEASRENLVAYPIFLGSFHGHSRASDGANRPRDVFAWARDSGAFDFYILTDHAELTSSSEYNTNNTLADEFNDEGTFVAMRGFEYSNPLNGHANVFGTSGQKGWSLLNLWTNTSFYNWVDSNHGIGQFNHPGDHGHFSHYAYVSKVADNFKLMETANGGDKNRSNKFVGYYNMALAKGWKLAPTGNVDNHSLTDAGVRTGVLATSLSRAAILDAMRNRRVYSSDDPFIELRFSLGDHWLGEVVSFPAGTYTFDLSAFSDELITKAEFVVKGTVSSSASFSANNILWRPSLVVSADTYAYVKVTEADGDVAISAPIWIDVP